MTSVLTRRRVVFGATALPLVLGSAAAGWARPISELERRVAEFELATRVDERRFARGQIPRSQLDWQHRRLDRARAELAAAGGGNQASRSGTSQQVSTPQSSSNADITKLERRVAEYELATRVDERRFARGEIPRSQLDWQHRRLDRARAELAAARGQTTAQPSTSSQPASTETAQSSNDTAQPASGSGPTVTVRNGNELRNALSSARAGTRIRLAAANYSGGRFEIRASGTVDNPIHIEAVQQLRAVLNSDLTVFGNHVHVTGLGFNGAGITLSGARAKVLRCAFANVGTAVSLDIADRAEIGYNSITNWSRRAIDLRPVRNGQTGRAHHIHHNHLFRPSRNASMGIRIGQQNRHHQQRVNALVEYNLLVDCPIDQTVQTKSSENTFRYNTLLNCGTISNRFGFNNKFIGNWIEESEGLWILDNDHEVRSNRLLRCVGGISIFAGDARSSDIPGGPEPDRFPHAHRVRLIDNDANRTIIGRTFGSFRRVLPALDTTITGHRGNVILSSQRNTRNTSPNNGNAGGMARKLSPGSVGPNA